MGIGKRSIGMVLLAISIAAPPSWAAPAPSRRPHIALIGVAGCVDEAHAQALREMGTLTAYGPMDEQKAIESLKGSDIAIASPYTVPLTRTVLESTDKLKLLVLSITGFDRVDMDAANGKGIRVVNMTDYSSEAVAEDTIGLMLAAIRHIPQADVAVLGRIGTRVAEIARGFGMKVIAWDHVAKSVDGVTQVSLEQLLAQSDVISLHLALNHETAGILGKARMQLLKPTAVLVNTARSELVDESALYAALHEGRLAGAALDVVTDTTPANPLLTLDNVVLSPHVGYHSRESRVRCADGVVKSVADYLAGNLPN
jgi:phosphoglycerate dehydrogenase-like enzyme